VVLKLIVPRGGGVAANEITVLRPNRRRAAVRGFLRHDASRGALLLERLGRSLSDLALPIDPAPRDPVCDGGSGVAPCFPVSGLPSGAEKGSVVADFITTSWEELDHPCSERAIDDALTCVARRIAAHDDERALARPWRRAPVEYPRNRRWFQARRPRRSPDRSRVRHGHRNAGGPARAPRGRSARPGPFGWPGAVVSMPPPSGMGGVVERVRRVSSASGTGSSPAVADARRADRVAP